MVPVLSFRMFAALMLVTASYVALLTVPASSFASGAYPVRLCSPETFKGDGSGGTFGTGNADIGSLRTYTSDHGQIKYDAAGYWKDWKRQTAAQQCGAVNTTSDGRYTYGLHMFNDYDVGWTRGQEGGIELVAPAGTTIGQVSFKARALQSPRSGVQGGLGGAGTKMVWSFVGAVNGVGTSGEAVPSNEGFAVYGSSGAVQNVSSYRIGVICSAPNGAEICFGPGQALLVQDVVATVVDSTKPNLRFLDTPASRGAWVSGKQDVSYLVGDGESGIHDAQVFVDGHLIDTKMFPCSTISGLGVGVSVPVAAKMHPCSTGLEGGTVTIDTVRYGDGQHQLKVCARDFGSATSYWGEDNPSCIETTLRVDNTPPTVPEMLQATPTRIPRAVQPEDVRWKDPGKGDPGAPIRKTIYEVVNSDGKVTVPAQTVKVDGPESVSADSVHASNITAIPTLRTPAPAGSYTLRVRVVDALGQVSGVSTVPLRYSCSNSGGLALPETNVALGLLRAGQDQAEATGSLALVQGEKAALLGRVRGPGGMRINNATTCVDAKPVTDPQPQRLAKVVTDSQGRYRVPLPAGPSRKLIAVVRQGHRESWSDEALTKVRVKPRLQIKRKQIKAGQALRFRGRIPGPHAGRVTVILQAKVGKGWQPFRYYRTRANGKYRLRYRPLAGRLVRPTKFVVRAIVPLQSGYPYRQGSSGRRVIVIRPRR